MHSRIFLGMVVGLCALVLPTLSFSPHTGISGDSTETLMTKLLQEPVHQPEVYTRAVQILESIESAPSCYRLAAVSLIDSCQVLESSSTSEVSLASVRETYAARLAMCELSSAGNPTPPQCDRFVPTIAACNQQSTSTKRFWTSRTQSVDSQGFENTCYPEFNSVHAKQCISSLSTRPQWWTSYSNALQNVLIVCQAGRDAVEKDSILRTFRDSARVHSEMTAAHASSLKRAAEFNIALEKTKAQVFGDMIAHAEQSKTTMAQIIVDFHKAYHSALAVFNVGVDTTASKLKKLNEDIVEGRSQILQANAAVDRLHANAVSHNSDIEVQQMQSLEKLSNRAMTLDELLQHLVDNKMAGIEGVMTAYHSQLQNFSQTLTASNSEVERHVAINTEILERQAEAIAKVKASSDDYTYLFLGFSMCYATYSTAPFIFKIFVLAGLLFFTLLKMSGLLSFAVSGWIYTLFSVLPMPAMANMIAVVAFTLIIFSGALYFIIQLNGRQRRAQPQLTMVSEKDGVSYLVSEEMAQKMGAQGIQIMQEA